MDNKVSRDHPVCARDWELTELLMSLTLENVKKKPTGVGLLYDDRMLEHRCIWVPTYPECPDRLKAAIDRCRHYHLVERFIMIPTRVAFEEEILLQHSKDYFEILKRSSQMTVEELFVLSGKYDAAYFHPTTYESAMIAAGCAIEAVEQVVAEKVRHSYALVRPPGHHAMHNESNGYCFFNNVAIATKCALEKLGLQRILIVDWDLHHGQGTQYSFYNDPRVLYFSIHRYEFGKFWPNLRQSDYDFIGEGPGRGFNVNVPFNKVDMKDGDYISIFQQILMPLAHEFDPQLVIVSCGYDAAIGDAEGKSEITPACYAHFTHMMKGLAGGKLCVIFEGGYCLKSMAEGVALTLKELLDDPCPLLKPLSPPMDSTKESILQVIRVLRPFWKCFAYHDDANSEDDLPEIFQNIEVPKKGVVFLNDETKPTKFTLDGYESYSDEEKKKIDKIIDSLIENTNLHIPLNRTCLVYDERMCQHKSPSSDHPERPSRITRIYDTLKELGMIDRCKILQPRIATDEEIALVHTKDYINEMKSYETCSVLERDSLAAKLHSVYLSQDVFLCASLAVGCTLNVVDELLKGQSLNGLAIVRPPGHHAESDSCMGFCYFNNVSIAAKYAQHQYNLQRVLILDWDVHHGNGTQHFFEDDPNVLYISIHRGKSFYPAGVDKSAENVGRGSGEGYNINIAWLTGGMGNSEYLAAFQQVVLPVAYEFGPELVLVSAGFDASIGDPLGGCCVSPEGFGHMTHLLSSLAGGRLILALEGGYNLNYLSESVAMCTSVLLGDLVPSIFYSSPNHSAVECIKETIKAHHSYWKCLSLQVKMTSREKTIAWLNEQRRNASLDKINLVSTETDHQINRKPDDSSNCSVSESNMKAPDEHLYAIGGKDATSSATLTLHELLGSLAKGEQSLELHAVDPLPWCPHLDSVQPLPPRGLHSDDCCKHCDAIGENWVCLVCYEVHCSRYQNSHMVDHNRSTGHLMALSYADLSIWCYICDSYVYNEHLMEAKRSAYQNKFNESMP